jgi:hypothetical protein
LPALHVLHKLEPLLGANFPAAHGEHDVTMESIPDALLGFVALLCVPTGHTVHE